MSWPRRAWRSLLRFGFRLLYHELAWTYDLVSRVVSLGQWRTWQRTALEHLAARRGDPILELAHGTGDLQIDRPGFRLYIPLGTMLLISAVLSLLASIFRK